MIEKTNKKSIRQNKWFILIILILSGGTIFKLSSLKDAFYIPIQTYFGLSHSQIGMSLSVYALIQTIGAFFSMYISDRFSKKKLIPFSLFGVGVVGFYLSTFPGYYGYLVAYAMLAIFAAVIYWPVLLKSVRLIGKSGEQGRMFGYLESGRGIIDTIIAFLALTIFTTYGSEKVGLKAAIIFLSSTIVVIGIISYVFLEDDTVRKVNKHESSLKGMLIALKSPEIWSVASNIFFVYFIYAGLTFFIPFLSEIYGLNPTLVGTYGIINQYGIKIIAGPIGGFFSDKVLKSSAKYIRFGFIIATIYMIGFTFLPHENMNVYYGIMTTLGFCIIIFTMRAVHYAPIDEIKVPKNITGAAMSIGSFAGSIASVCAYTLYGSLLDSNPGITGYKYIFVLLAIFSSIGMVVSTRLVKHIKKINNP